ncbi:TetR/AcrR family transcriptional regulator [Hymenobacter saemangeumensis]|uniref:TetR/AcrR family transcriptional regulator n=1 Tax=Hymenobacter saemangeumensis TaxID=1084522 RepID=UPI0031E5E766
MEAVVPVFRRYGADAAPDEAVAAALHIPVNELSVHFSNRHVLVKEATLADLERQKREHVEIFQKYPTAVERLFGLIQQGLTELANTPPEYYAVMQQKFPQAWDVLMQHLDTYSSPQLQQLLNEGIRQRLFRSDINIQLVTKILLEQTNMLLNPAVFPPERYNMAEVFRCIFLYYIRGLCTDEGARIAANHFSRI